MVGVQLLAQLVVDEISTVVSATVESPIKFFRVAECIYRCAPFVVYSTSFKKISFSSVAGNLGCSYSSSFFKYMLSSFSVENSLNTIPSSVSSIRKLLSFELLKPYECVGILSKEIICIGS